MYIYMYVCIYIYIYIHGCFCTINVLFCLNKQTLQLFPSMAFWHFCWQSSVKQASRAQILDKATEYIQYMRRKNHTHQQDIDDLKKQNALLEQQGEWRGRTVSLVVLLQQCCGLWVPMSNMWSFSTAVFLLLWIAVRALEKAKGNTQLQTNYSSDSSLYTNRKGSAVSAFDGGSDSSSESEPDEPPNRKKLRVEPS